jgi:hypothetical protein
MLDSAYMDMAAIQNGVLGALPRLLSLALPLRR